ncbi:ATP-binding cassette domain-containing protein [Klebsiella pneumoniae]|uniref:ABC transporter ATP-binding protein n=1 Tax=Escherichia coli TaxID=562 RepID=UPI000B7E1AA2|nr:ATP-binding cassette domain-containing protein [Escherichia coli]EIX9792528.1 ATP-binding cassette domain-containing protein [Klebsiella pneumoniae]HBC8790896.1 ATP-binding cassette domain-containing protein [Citrobacter braakii]EEY4090967.1 ATP-binding cassette domain-containing protein [Escherichia coli]MCN2811673.1 ATP-binding cassette domain-containing protein [Escherichia coli]HAX2580316.1 ATP-binding cassette domain-containing protein [Escherichia coli]
MIRLRIDNKNFDERILFSNFKFTAERGDFIILTGPSGAGKSTLLNIIGLLDQDYDGEYFFLEESVSQTNLSQALDIRRDYFGYVFQNSLINEQQSIIRNLLCSVNFSQQARAKELAPDVLNMVGIEYSKKAASLLSGGEKQRLALARALIKEPVVLLADEPTASLDHNNKARVMEILRGFNQRSGTVIMITHDTGLIKKEMKVIEINN